MAGLLDLFSGRSSDIYGNGLLTPEQRGGLGNIGLLALAGKLGQLAGPSFSPVPDFGAALGQAAGAYGASQEGAGTAALNAILTGQKGRKLEQELDYYKQLGPVLGKLAGDWPGAGGGTGGGEGSGSTGGGAAAPPGAGGGGGGGAYWTPEGLAALRPTEGRYDQIHYPSGNPSTASGAYGFLDSTWREQAPKAGVDINQYPRAYLAPPAVQDKVAAITPIHHWTGVDANGKPFNAAAQRLATNPNYVAGAAPTAAAPALNVGERAAPLSPGGGLLTPTAPNPLSNADPMLPIARPRVGPQAAAGPGDAGADLLGAGMSPEMVARYLARPAPGAGAAPAAVAPAVSRPGASPEDTANQILRGWTAGASAPGQGAALAEQPGFAGRQLVAQLLARPPVDDLSQFQQVAGPGGGEGPIATAPIPPRPAPPPLAIPDLPPQAAAALAQAMPGLLMPGGGLLPRGGAMTGMPPAVAPADAMPSDDPRLQLGPLAPTPAPAPAAPTAPGPGLLSPPGAPAAAPALPRGANPAYDAYLRNLATAGTLAEGAGLKNVFAPMIDALTKSPAYQAAVEREKARIGVEFAGPRTTAEQTALEPFKIREQQRALENELTKDGWKIENGQAIPLPNYNTVREAKERSIALGQTGPKLDADLAKEGKQLLYDSAGKPVIVGIPGWSKTAAASAGEIKTAEAQAAADVQQATAPKIAADTKYAETTATQDAAARQQAIAARNTLPLLDDSKEQLTGAGIFSGPTANLDMTLAQLSTAAGWPSDKLVNTQTYVQQAGVRALAILSSGALGSGPSISSKDVETAQRMAAGDITVDIRTIRRITDLAERKAIRDIDTFNDIAKKRDPTSAIEHPTRWTGRKTDAGERIMRKPDGSLEVETR